jgi:hypothetical protein
VKGDEALRAARQELAFAEAEFGENEVAELRTAVDEAEALLRKAFAQRQQVEDEEKPDQEQQAALKQVVQLSEDASLKIERAMASLDEMRRLQDKVEEVLPVVEGELAHARGRLPEVRAALTGLTAYAQSGWLPVKNNVTEAEADLDACEDDIEQARAGLASGDRAETASHVRAVQRRLGRANSLLDAVVDLAARMREAEQRAGPELAAAEADVVSARQAATNGHADLKKVSEAEAALAAAKRAFSSRPPDYVSATDLAVRANSTADEVLAYVRGEAERRDRELEIARSAIRGAEAKLQRAADYLDSRHGRIQVEGRSLLTEARRRLEAARDLLPDEPRRAAQEAQQAAEIAEDSLSYSMRDYGDFTGMGRRGGLGDLASILLGGILMGGGGFGGGGTWGSGRSGNGSVFRGGGRSMGGGFGGMGGRSRGGRW